LVTAVATEDIEFQLSQLLDGELPEEQAAALRRRIAADPALAEQFRRYQALEEGLGRLGSEMPAVDWDLQRESIRSVLEREALLKPMSTPWRGVLFRWSAAAAAAAACVIVGLLTINWLVSGGWGAGKPMVTASIQQPPGVTGAGINVATVSPLGQSVPEGDLSVQYEGHPAGESSQGVNAPQADTWAWADQPGTIIISGGERESQPQAAAWGLDEL
jgi:anti-sigma factor RsiW